MKVHHLYLTSAWILSKMENTIIGICTGEVLAWKWMQRQQSLATTFVSFRNLWMGKLILSVPAVELKYSWRLCHRAWLANWHWTVALWWQSLSGHGHCIPFPLNLRRCGYPDLSKKVTYGKQKDTLKNYNKSPGSNNHETIIEEEEIRSFNTF